jgi:hypothetical protein
MARSFRDKVRRPTEWEHEVQLACVVAFVGFVVLCKREKQLRLSVTCLYCRESFLREYFFMLFLPTVPRKLQRWIQTTAVVTKTIALSNLSSRTRSGLLQEST